MISMTPPGIHLHLRCDAHEKRSTPRKLRGVAMILVVLSNIFLILMLPPVAAGAMFGDESAVSVVDPDSGEPQ